MTNEIVFCKNSSKITTNGLKDIKLGIKNSIYYCLCDERCFGIFFFKIRVQRTLYFNKRPLVKSNHTQTKVQRDNLEMYVSKFGPVLMKIATIGSSSSSHIRDFWFPHPPSDRIFEKKWDFHPLSHK